MEPVLKQLTCPACSKTVIVRVVAGGDQQRWQCPECKKIQTSDRAAVDAAPPA
jgi:transposase-like protein